MEISVSMKSKAVIRPHLMLPTGGDKSAKKAESSAKIEVDHLSKEKGEKDND